MRTKIFTPKKNLLIISILVCFFYSLSAQVLLDIEGDAKFLGKISLINSVNDSSMHIGVNTGINIVANGKIKDNTFIGNNAGKASTLALDNTFIGANAGKGNITGNANVFVGNDAGLINFSGDLNTFVGNGSGFENTGSSNVFLGYKAGFNNEAGTKNTYVGTLAGSGGDTGNFNTFLGFDSGKSTNSSLSTFLGAQASVLNAFDVWNKAIAIGYNAKVNCDNCAAIGGTGLDAVKVGIGTSTPVYNLDVHHDTGIPTPNNSPGNGINISNINGAALNWQLYVGGSLGKLRLYKNGTIRGTFDETSGNYAPSSDKRLKNNIRTLKKQLSLIQRLRPTTYQFKGRKSSRKVYGLIAQEVQKVLPDIVLVNEGDNPKMQTLGISYTELIPVLIAGMQEQQTIIDQQQTDYEALKSEMEELKSLVENLISDKENKSPINNYSLPLKQDIYLGQNQPNPFKGNTLIKYHLPEDFQQAFIQIRTAHGKILGKTPILDKGNGQITIQSQDYPTGTYYYSLVVDGKVTETRKMVLVN